MSDLPSGTVTMLFSDIEGSTLLLHRLGSGYIDALDGQRQVLRKAWVAHQGVEMGTEGDSFFVVFSTAETAVAAAIQAQCGLAEYPWPGGERVRVRIGIHTGSPQVHDGNYVGMDVHRAARIAGSAHGGQVVVSSATADLARSGLPAGVRLRDLGTHHLKDIAEAEHLFQLAIDGLPADFPALKTIGAASSLPAPTTVLVGRETEVDDVTALLRSPGVRLVTLTGPGGTGKTRLVIAVAQRLVAHFADGVFFVPLASVTSAEVMWTSIAETMDVPPNARTPARLLTYLAPRTALLVLDNLEQLRGADEVVAELLAAAPHVAVLATSRRALSVAGEQRRPVPPLALPEQSTISAAEAAGAVQLFVQQARSVRPDFALTANNVADVVAICRRLDGLPLAIELTAARVRLLGTAAVLRRLDQALDIPSTSRQTPSRQKTLRNTIAWSYDLLDPPQRALCRRLGVFAGGGDLEAVAAVASVPADVSDGAASLDLVADLVDASLVGITEGPDGEPRVAMLETIRAYALDQLRAADEADAVRSAHVEHYLLLAERLEVQRKSNHLLARSLAETDLDNFRESLAWSVVPRAARDSRTGMRLCSALGWFWYIGGYLTEGRQWYERVLDLDAAPSEELAACLAGFANLLIPLGEPDRAKQVAARGLEMARTLGSEPVVAYALGVLGTAHQHLGQLDAASAAMEEALRLRRRLGDRSMLNTALGNLAGIEEELGNFDHAEALTREALEIVRQRGDVNEAAVQEQNLANLLAISGRPAEARQLAEALVDAVLQVRSPILTMGFANTYMNILVRLGEPVAAARLLGAELAMRERLSMPNPFEQEERDEALALIRGQISVEEWNHHCQLGREHTVEELLAQLAAP